MKVGRSGVHSWIGDWRFRFADCGVNSIPGRFLESLSVRAIDQVQICSEVHQFRYLVVVTRRLWWRVLVVVARVVELR